jgi:hypothetical protein
VQWSQSCFRSSEVGTTLAAGSRCRLAETLQVIQNRVAADTVTQYGIAQRNGSAMDVCVQAGMVTAAYLQAKDEPNYQRWKQIEKADCEKAGLANQDPPSIVRPRILRQD